MSIDDAKNRQYELLVDTNGRRRWFCLETNLLVLFFFGLSIQMDEPVGFV